MDYTFLVFPCHSFFLLMFFFLILAHAVLPLRNKMHTTVSGTLSLSVRDLKNPMHDLCSVINNTIYTPQ